MEAKELRIGNWVWNDVQEIPFQVDSGLISLYETREKCGFKEALPKPIPLTEEWLIRLGVDNEYEVTIKANRKKITFSWGSRVVSTGKRFSWTCVKYPHIKHVHQLQNLYFALTGKELTIKE